VRELEIREGKILGHSSQDTWKNMRKYKSRRGGKSLVNDPNVISTDQKECKVGGTGKE